MAGFDRSQLDALESHLAGLGPSLQAPLGKVIDKGGKNIARVAKQIISGQIRGRYLPHYAKSISSEMVESTTAEIGPGSGKRQGGMGPGVEFGSVNHGPLPHMFPAADQEIPNTEREIAQAAAKNTL